jgi:hypothetical protein
MAIHAAQAQLQIFEQDILDCPRLVQHIVTAWGTRHSLSHLPDKASSPGCCGRFSSLYFFFSQHRLRGSFDFAKLSIPSFTGSLSITV